MIDRRRPIAAVLTEMNLSARSLAAGMVLFSLPLFSLVAAGLGIDTGKLGTVHFESGGDPQTRAEIESGVKLLHHMMYVEAGRAFSAALARDPKASFAHWGLAMTVVHPLWPDIPDTADLTRGEQWIKEGLERGNCSPRERAYLEATGELFRNPESPSYPARLKAADAAWAKVASAYPEDCDAAAFAALFHLAPARFMPRDKSHRVQIEAAAALEAILTKIPDHPGALHYKIHAYDFPLLAGRAIETCGEYGAIAPDVPHALHMPTHIYTRLGEWEKSIEFNERSAEAARRLIRADQKINSHLLHALDYLTYAYLQRGEYKKAEGVYQEIAALQGPFQTVNRPAMAFAFAAIPARLALERQDWKSAAQLGLRQPTAFPWNDSFSYCDSLIHFARGLGAIRTDDLQAARNEIEAIAALDEKIASVIPGSYWASQASVQLTTLRAWLSLREEHPGAALSLMRSAAATEAAMDKDAVTPGEVIPAGELLGEMLLELGQAKDALAAFQTQLELSPNRFNAVFGAGRAAELGGDAEVAKRYYLQLTSLGANADPGNSRLEHAKTFLAQR